jgi:DNA-binding CsgD family transcriptional regulator
VAIVAVLVLLTVPKLTRRFGIRRAQRSPRMQQSVRGSTLTPRQHQIVALIAAGFTNGEIADRLGLTPGTVSEHIANIRWCLDLGRRREIAAWMVKQAGATPHRLVDQVAERPPRLDDQWAGPRRRSDCLLRADGSCVS